MLDEMLLAGELQEPSKKVCYLAELLSGIASCAPSCWYSDASAAS